MTCVIELARCWNCCISISFQTHTRTVHNWFEFVRCGYRDFNEVCNLSCTCSMSFNLVSMRPNYTVRVQPSVHKTCFVSPSTKRMVGDSVVLFFWNKPAHTRKHGEHKEEKMQQDPCMSCMSMQTQICKLQYHIHYRSTSSIHLDLWHNAVSSTHELHSLPGNRIHLTRQHDTILPWSNDSPLWLKFLT